MDEAKRAKMIDWVKKLIALSNANGFDGEAQSAKEKAEYLMDIYQITMADLIAEQDVRRFIGRIDLDGMGDAVKQWEVHLFHMIAKAFNCKTVYRSHDYATGHWSMSVVGTDKDMEIVIWFHKYLRRTVMSLAIKEYSLKRQQDSFAIGMADRIGERLREMYDKQEAWIREHGGEATMALVVVKKQEVDAEYHKQWVFRPFDSCSL